MDLKTGHIKQELLSDLKEVNWSETSAIEAGLGTPVAMQPTLLKSL